MVDTNFSSHLCNPRNIIGPKRCMFYPGNLRGQGILDFFVKETWGYEGSKPSSCVLPAIVCVIFMFSLFSCSFAIFICFYYMCFSFHVGLLLAGSWTNGC